jgi:hypothetical protein
MVWADELYILSPSDMMGHVSTVFCIDREIPGSMQY